jgi:hypothetical protein
MTELLKKWAELEPGLCSTGALAAWVTLSRTEHPVALTVATLASERAIILAAVIEAIEARGWWWNVGTTLQLPVQAYVQSPERNFRPVRAETPAAALLGAYLAALEAEAVLRRLAGGGD